MYGIGQAAFRGVRASILGTILDTRAKTIISRIAHKETLRSFHCFIKEEPLFNLLASRKASTEKKKLCFVRNRWSMFTARFHVVSETIRERFQ